MYQSMNQLSMNEWMNEWMNQPMGELMNQIINELIKSNQFNQPIQINQFN